MQQGHTIKEYLLPNGSSPFRQWLERLSVKTRARIQARIFRFELGNLGDYKSVGEGVLEARLDFGPGYRVYFGIDKRTVVILLQGGEKGSQKRDIKKAKEYWKSYREKQNAKTK